MISRVVSSTRGAYGLEKEYLEQELSLKAYMPWQAWVPEGGTQFSTYIFDVLTKHKNYLIRTAKAQRCNCGLQPFFPRPKDGDGVQGDNNPCAIYDFCANTNSMDLDDYVYMLEVRSVIEKVLPSQSSRAQSAIQRVLEGETQESVSRETGIAQSQVSYYLNSFRTKLHNELERKGVDLPFTTSVKSGKKKQERGIRYRMRRKNSAFWQGFA